MNAGTERDENKCWRLVGGTRRVPKEDKRIAAARAHTASAETRSW
jgi:hypothetical protein